MVSNLKEKHVFFHFKTVFEQTTKHYLIFLHFTLFSSNFIQFESLTSIEFVSFHEKDERHHHPKRREGKQDHSIWESSTTHKGEDTQKRRVHHNFSLFFLCLLYVIFLDVTLCALYPH